MAMKSLHQLIPHHHNPVPRLSTNWPANRAARAARSDATAASTATAQASELAEMTRTISGISFAFPCPECGEHYHLTLGQIVLSQDDLASGCDARGENECQSVHYASLVDRGDIEELARAWVKIEAAVTAAGGHAEAPGTAAREQEETAP